MSLTAAERISMSEQRRLRDAFGRYTTGVAVVTTRRGADRWAAITVNSFTSVSLDPPLVLFALGLSSNSRALFEHCDRFAVSILRCGQQAISTNFARPSQCSWDEVQTVLESGTDLTIADALASFRCRRTASLAAGDHVLILGQVTEFSCAAALRPLAFFAGTYGSFSPDQSSRHPSVEGSFGDREVTLGWG